MSENQVYFNPSALQKPTPDEPEKEKKIKEGKIKKNKKPKSTRSIRFVKRGVQNYLTYFFWLILIVMFFFTGIGYARYGLLIKKVNQKATDPQEIVSQLNVSKELETIAQYESQKFVEELFTINADNKDSRKDYLESKLAVGLTGTNFFRAVAGTEQELKSLKLIDKKMVSQKENQFYFVYEVVYLSNKNEVSTQLKVTSSLKNGEFKVINVPTYLNMERSANLKHNDSQYNEKSLFSSGEKVDQSQKKSLEQFTNEFFKLYVKNDDSLRLISNVTGLTEGTLSTVSVKNVVKKDQTYIVEGNYTFQYEESTELISYFSLQITQSNDTYFVNQLN